MPTTQAILMLAAQNRFVELPLVRCVGETTALGTSNVCSVTSGSLFKFMVLNFMCSTMNNSVPSSPNIGL